MRCNRETSKLRMLYPKRSSSKDSLRSQAESLRWKTTVRKSVAKVSSKGVMGTGKCCKWPLSNCLEREGPRSYPTCSTIVKRSSSQALVASSTSVEGSRSSGSKIFPFHYGEDDDDDDDYDDDIESGEHEIIEVIYAKGNFEKQRK